jgi:hypothetical protein
MRGADDRATAAGEGRFVAGLNGRGASAVDLGCQK